MAGKEDEEDEEDKCMIVEESSAPAPLHESLRPPAQPGSGPPAGRTSPALSEESAKSLDGPESGGGQSRDPRPIIS